MNRKDFIENEEKLIELSKIDLHRHLLGCVTSNTVINLAKKYSLEIPTFDENKLEKILTINKPVSGLKEFFRPWKVLSRLIISPEVVFILAFEALRDAAKDNVRYVELRTSWGLTGKEPFSLSEYLSSLNNAIKTVEKEFNIIARVILGISRHIMAKHDTNIRKKLYNEILETSLDFKDFCVVGFELNGIEDGYPPSMFKDFFGEAKDEGFKVTIHSGETQGPADIWEAINELYADRIGHAISAIQDEKLLTYLHRNKIHIEICPTSNILTSTVVSIKKHPIKQFKVHGLKYSINTDNPAICKVSLSKEYANLIRNLNFNYDDIKKSIRNAVEASFAPAKIKYKINKLLCG